MNRFRSRVGGFSIFLALSVSAMFMLMGVLTTATLLHARETRLKTALLQQQDLLLSRYSEILEQRYGLYATRLDDDSERSFRVMTGDVGGTLDYRATGLDPLKGAVLYDEIVRFSSPRFPVQASVRLLDRLNIIKANLLEGVPEIPSAGEWEATPILSGEMSCIGFDEIIELLTGFRDTQSSSSEDVPSEKSFPLMDELMTMVSGYEVADPYESGISRTIRSELGVTEKTLNNISGFVEDLCSFDPGNLYRRLTFEWYVASMFSCSVNYSTEGCTKVYRTDMRGRGFDERYTIDVPEIEQIIFGQESEEQNRFYTKISIQGIRFVSNLIANLSDSAQRAKVRTLAATVCAIVAFVSGGTVAIPPEAAEAAVLVIRSATQASQDYEELMQGGCVDLVPVEGFDRLETRYSDYLSLLLLVVPKDVKLERIRTILERNTVGEGVCLYTGVGVSCSYRGKRYFSEGGYHE